MGVNFEVNSKHMVDVKRGMKLAKRVQDGVSFDSAIDLAKKDIERGKAPGSCEFSLGQYHAIRNRLSVGDLKGAKDILYDLEKAALGPIVGYSGQDRYYGLGAGAIATYIAYVEDNKPAAAGYLDAAISRAEGYDTTPKRNNDNAKLAIIEMAAVCGLEKFAYELAEKEFGNSPMGFEIAKEKIKFAKPNILPDY